MTIMYVYYKAYHSCEHINQLRNKTIPQLQCNYNNVGFYMKSCDIIFCSFVFSFAKNVKIKKLSSQKKENNVILSV